MIESYYGPGWNRGRAEIYDWLSKCQQSELDEIQIRLKGLGYGWLDMDFFVNGGFKHTVNLSECFDPTDDIKRWLEDIVDDTRLMSTLEIDQEGHCATLVYEHIQRASVGVGKKECVLRDTNEDPFWSVNDLDIDTGANWIKYDAFSHFDYGLIYLYESDSDQIKFKGIVHTKKFVSTVYMTFLTFAWRYRKELSEKWFRKEDSCQWLSYNSMKSQLIEWNMNANEAYRHCKPIFKEQPKIDCVIHMWAEWGDALFWIDGKCCGNADTFSTDDATYDLTYIKGLREWYNKMDNNALNNWSEEEWQAHTDKGYEFAKEIRKLLPSNIDLFYSWIPLKYDMDEVEAPCRMVPLDNTISKH